MLWATLPLCLFWSYFCPIFLLLGGIQPQNLKGCLEAGTGLGKARTSLQMLPSPPAFPHTPNSLLKGSTHLPLRSSALRGFHCDRRSNPVAVSQHSCGFAPVDPWAVAGSAVLPGVAQVALAACSLGQLSAQSPLLPWHLSSACSSLRLADQLRLVAVSCWDQRQ